MMMSLGRLVSFYWALFLLLAASSKNGRSFVSAKAWGSKSFADVVKEGAATDESKKDETCVEEPPNKKTSAITRPKNVDPPYYSRLPRGAKKYRVRNVYDGDTLTLVEEQRVRLLGIDTPEIKERQPYAQEAKAYTKKYCHKQEIWLSFERGQNYQHNRKDHYGRLLAHVWVKVGGDNASPLYLCVNEGMVAAGLASVYSPDTQSRTGNWPILLELQKQARTAKMGIWKNFQDLTVYKTKNGSAYHLKTCQHLSTARHLTPLKVSEAADAGLHPCRSCLG